MARTEDYPERDQFFANKFVRIMTKAALANEIGPEACWLLTVVAQQEDVKRYRGAVTYYNGQLAALVGLGSAQSLIRVRAKAIKSGWLHYESAGRSRKAGRYWCVVPEGLEMIPDTPCDETNDVQCGEYIDNGDDHQRTRSGLEADSKRIYTTPSGIEAELKRNRSGIEALPFLPLPLPTPTPTKKEFSEELVGVVDKLLRKTRIGMPAETAAEAISQGLTLDQITAVIDYWSSRDDLGPGMLRHRLISPSAPNLPPDEGWPEPSDEDKTREKIRHRRETEQAAATKRTSRQAVQKQKRDGERVELALLEFEFGNRLDHLPRDNLRELLNGDQGALRFLDQHGPTHVMIRTKLLRALSTANKGKP